MLNNQNLDPEFYKLATGEFYATDKYGVYCYVLRIDYFYIVCRFIDLTKRSRNLEKIPCIGSFSMETTYQTIDIQNYVISQYAGDLYDMDHTLLRKVDFPVVYKDNKFFINIEHTLVDYVSVCKHACLENDSVVCIEIPYKGKYKIFYEYTSISYDKLHLCIEKLFQVIGKDKVITFSSTSEFFNAMYHSTIASSIYPQPHPVVFSYNQQTFPYYTYKIGYSIYLFEEDDYNLAKILLD